MQASCTRLVIRHFIVSEIIPLFFYKNPQKHYNNSFNYVNIKVHLFCSKYPVLVSFLVQLCQNSSSDIYLRHRKYTNRTLAFWKSYSLFFFFFLFSVLIDKVNHGYERFFDYNSFLLLPTTYLWPRVLLYSSVCYDKSGDNVIIFHLLCMFAIFN